jgi:hypothetical protein
MEGVIHRAERERVHHSGKADFPHIWHHDQTSMSKRIRSNLARHEVLQANGQEVHLEVTQKNSLQTNATQKKQKQCSKRIWDSYRR